MLGNKKGLKQLFNQFEYRGCNSKKVCTHYENARYKFNQCCVHGCTKPALNEFKCKNCNVVSYCSVQHKNHDALHKSLCRLIMITEYFKCPITGTFMINPVRFVPKDLSMIQNSCHHLYEKEAIKMLLSNNNDSVGCPHDNCSHELDLSIGMFVEDKKIKKAISVFLAGMEKNTQSGPVNIFNIYKGRLKHHLFSRTSMLAKVLDYNTVNITINVEYVGINHNIKNKTSLSFKPNLNLTLLDIMHEFYNENNLNIDKIQNGYKKDYQLFVNKFINISKIDSQNVNEIIKSFFNCSFEFKKLDLNKTIKELGLYDKATLCVHLQQDKCLELEIFEIGRIGLRIRALQKKYFIYRSMNEMINHYKTISVDDYSQHKHYIDKSISFEQINDLIRRNLTLKQKNKELKLAAKSYGKTF